MSFTCSARNHDETLESEMDASFLSTATAEASGLYQNVGRVIGKLSSAAKSHQLRTFILTSPSKKITVN